MRRTDARSAQIGGPDFIAQAFQVKTYSGEPVPPSWACNLLPKDRWRHALGDKVSPDWPQVALVVDSAALARDAKRLAGTRSGPNWNVIWPPGETKGEGPPSDPREEVGLCVADDVFGLDFLDAAVIDNSRRDMSRR